jgi:hypothetical protein
MSGSSSGIGFGGNSGGGGYQYINALNSPSQAGSTADGTLPSLGTNSNVLMGYATALWEGGPNNPVVNTSNLPLGDAFFYNTGQTCNIDTSNNSGSSSSSDSSSNTVMRHVYINNQPIGRIGGATGILPGIVEKIMDFQPLGFIDELVSIGTPTCQSVTLSVVDNSGNGSYETHYLALSDIKNLYDCHFQSGVNPFGSNPCGDNFTNLNTKKKSTTNIFSIILLIFIIFFIVINV